MLVIDCVSESHARAVRPFMEPCSLWHVPGGAQLRVAWALKADVRRLVPRALQLGIFLRIE